VNLRTALKRKIILEQKYAESLSKLTENIPNTKEAAKMKEKARKIITAENKRIWRAPEDMLALDITT